MKANHIKTAMLSLAAVTFLLSLAACGESLEDTYKDYTQEGIHRYLGKCNDLTAKPGWKRISVNWTNSTDPVVDKVKLKWSLEDTTDSVILNRGTDSYNIVSLCGQDLDDGNYKIVITSIDKEGNPSIESTIFSRPYTYGHEEVQAFNRLISNIYIVKNHLIMRFMAWQDNMLEAKLTYTKSDGIAGSFDLNADIVGKGYYELPDLIDASKPIAIYRKGELPGCEDIIDFEPYEFSHDRSYEADFKEDMKRQYGVADITDDWANSIETLYLDQNYSNLLDIMNLPNLKRVILGSRRYIKESEVDDAEYAQNKIYDAESSLFALDMMHKLNGITVERYNKHYQSLGEKDYIIDRGLAVEPSLNMLPLANASISCYPKDEEGFDSGLEQLIKGDETGYWEPLRGSNAEDYELTIDLKSQQALKGMRLVQRTFQKKQEQIVAPSAVKIKLSDDNIQWTDATYMEQVVVGNSNGEVCHIPFIPGSKARYVKLIIPSVYYYGQYFSSLGAVRLY